MYTGSVKYLDDFAANSNTRSVGSGTSLEASALNSSPWGMQRLAFVGIISAGCIATMLDMLGFGSRIIVPGRGSPVGDSF